jgi:hypothetical protein
MAHRHVTHSTFPVPLAPARSAPVTWLDRSSIWSSIWPSIWHKRLGQPRVKYERARWWSPRPSFRAPCVTGFGNPLPCTAGSDALAAEALKTQGRHSRALAWAAPCQRFAAPLRFVSSGLWGRWRSWRPRHGAALAHWRRLPIGASLSASSWLQRISGVGRSGRVRSRLCPYARIIDVVVRPNVHVSAFVNPCVPL